MNLVLFFIIWVIIWFIPIPPTSYRFISKRRFAVLFAGLILFAFNFISQTPLVTFVYFMVFTRVFAAVAEYFVSRSILKEATYDNRTVRLNIPWAFNFKQKNGIFGIAIVVILFLSIVCVGVYGEVQRVSNAQYFKGSIVTESGLPFDSTIPDDMVRLVTKELAVSIARRHMSEFGSNTQVLDCHITKNPEGKLVWVATIGSTNILSENYIKGFVIVDANEPTATPEIVHTQFNVGTNLWLDKNIPFRNYLDKMENVYGVSYVTWQASNQPVYVVTQYNLGFDFIKRYEAPTAYDAHGNLVASPQGLSDVPSWITQVYDEAWLEEMINEMGTFSRGGAFDYFAGGFLWIVPPSQDRFEITEDTRYVVDPASTDVVALVCVNPVENQRTLSGVFKATPSGIQYYDFKQSNYISGLTAEDLVEGRLPKPATGTYTAIMPLLYTVDIGGGTQRLAWYVPIYWYEGYDESGNGDETVYLAGFAVVDAQDTNKISLAINEEGISSEQLVRQTRLDFIKLFGGTVNADSTVNAKVVKSFQYVQNGLTHIVLNLNDATYPWIEATPQDLTSTEWNQLMSIVSGQTVTAHLEKQDDRWMMMDFNIVS